MYCYYETYLHRKALGVKGSIVVRNGDIREISTHCMMKYKRDDMTGSKCPTFLSYVTNKGIKQTKTDDKHSSCFLKNLRRRFFLVRCLLEVEFSK